MIDRRESLSSQNLAERGGKVRGEQGRRQLGRRDEVSGQTERRAKDQLSGAKPSIRAHRGPNAQKDQWQMIHPSRRRRPGTEALLDDPVDALYHPIALGMVGGSAERGYAQESVELRPQGGHELPPLIRSNVSRDAKPADPMTEQSASTQSSGHVHKRNSLHPTGRPIQHREEVGEPLRRRQRADEIHMQRAEASVRHWTTRQR